MLDVIVTSTLEIFLRTGVLQNSLSDHLPIYGVVPGLLRRHQHRVITPRRWSEEKVDSFQTDMNKIPWSDLNTPENIDRNLENWLQFFTSSLNKHSPFYKKRIRQKTHPWLDSTILRLMRRRDYVHKRARRLGYDDLWSLYRRLRNEVTSRLRRQKGDYFLHHLNEHKANPKVFWKTLRLALQSKKQTANINKLTVENKERTQPKLIVKSLNAYFTKITDSVLSNGYQRCGTRSFSTSPTVLLWLLITVSRASTPLASNTYQMRRYTTL